MRCGPVSRWVLSLQMCAQHLGLRDSGRCETTAAGGSFLGTIVGACVCARVSVSVSIVCARRVRACASVQHVSLCVRDTRVQACSE